MYDRHVLRRTVYAPPSMLVRRLQGMLIPGTVTLFAVLLLTAYFQPIAFMVVGSVKPTQDYYASPDQPLLPMVEATYTYEGTAYHLYEMPTAEGVQVWAMVKMGRKESLFVDPAHPEQGLITWQGNWRSLEKVWVFQFQWDNFPTAWKEVDLALLIQNSLIVSLIGTAASILSSLPVAYGFARFRLPGKQILFLVMLGTIIMPAQITFIPTYLMYTKLGWVGTWLPLLIPRFFASAFNVFLLRQVFMTIPREMDEAAMLDGAGPLTILFRIIIPITWPAVVTVTLLQFFYIWNDFYTPALYLGGNQALWTVPMGLGQYNAFRSVRPDMLQAATLISMVIPMVVYILMQNVFMQGLALKALKKRLG